MKLSTQTIEGLIERKDRLWSRENLYRYMGSVNHPVTEITFLGFLRQVTALGAFEVCGNHYKLKDVKKLGYFIRKLG